MTRATGPDLDIITMGRCSVDLYGQQIGSRLEDVSSFAKSVGGSPSNIAIGTARLGLKVGLITRVGDEQMGRFVREQLQRERFSLLSGKFTPSRGDLVFSKTGELLGVMANKEYCLMLGELSATRGIRLGTNISDQQPAQFLAQMYNRLIGLPYQLQ